jgi:glutamate synthase (NADPH/NADH) large chain
MRTGLPKAQGMYNPENEHDACGIGFVAHIKGQKSHEIVRRGLDVLINMTHRGAESADNVTGDGAGILMQMPHEFFVSKGVKLPASGQYGAGIVFLPKDKKEADKCLKIFEDVVVKEGLSIISYRELPVNTLCLGEIARGNEPAMKQVFITGKFEQDELERKLYIIRKLSENAVRNSDIHNKDAFYFPSLSSKVMIYKGMLTPIQVREYFPDLSDSAMVSAISMVHSRFSTNTFPTWDLAQPFRYLAHNGEINTIKGNRNWMKAREGLLKTDLFGDNIQKLFPIVEPGKSDSASLDNALEFLHLSGRSLPHALAMLIPESWNSKNPIPESLKAFYEFYSSIMEPWDGPASIVFCDGRFVGGTLDRNGLRPSRYVITKNDIIAMGSEVGCQVFPPEDILVKGRQRPGKILLIDTKLGVMIPDVELKAQLAKMNPYQQWLKDSRLELSDIKVKQRVPSELGDDLGKYMKVFGYTKEDAEQVILPMANEGYEPTGSMGADTPLAVLSERPYRMFNYFRQLFAQVTNPPIDPIREGLVMSLANYIGSVSKNVLVDSPSHCKSICFQTPIVTNTDLAKLKNLNEEGFRHKTLDMLFPVKGGKDALKKAVHQMCADAEKAVDEGFNYIILSDRGINEANAPIPSLLATAAVHHHLINAKKRMQVGLVIESAEPREVHHFACLSGYGASIINPYGAFAVISDMCQKGKIKSDYVKAREYYIKSIDAGLLKILSKMGISTIRSYHGAQIFEALGISDEVIKKHFIGTSSRIGGLGFEELQQEASISHKQFFEEGLNDSDKTFGFYQYRRDGEIHAWDPESIALLQWATKTNNYSKFKEFTSYVDKHNQTPIFLRGFLDFKKSPIPIEKVESVSEITKRFITGAMSYGSISAEAHTAMADAMNRIGGKSNTGEGGEDSDRFKIQSDGRNLRSAVKQVASGRFGVTANYLVNADEIQIKVAQGAKPGEGGQLPGLKVNKIIAKLRHSTPGITLISPPPHHDIYSIEDLKQLIFDLKCTNPRAKISVKLVSEDGVGTVAAGVAKAKADIIIISGYEGGTGASPISSIKHAGLPMEMGISESHQTLVMNNLRGRVRLQTDGQLKTGRDVVLAAMLGAEEFAFATGALIVLGCIMMRKCHLNTCPVGVATQEEELRKRFIGKSEYLVNYFTFIAQEIREYMAELGIAKFDDLVGRADLLTQRKFPTHWKAKTVDVSKLIFVPEEAKKYPLHNVMEQHHDIEGQLDHAMIKQANSAIKNKEKVWIAMPITNIDRTVGAMLSGVVALKYGDAGLPEDTINARFTGSAGQSFGAFTAKGITFRLEGDANDYLGKGLCGGKLIVVPPAAATYIPEDNIIVGNTLLYGATDGEVYIRGIAGERFCVRNSGAIAVVEGVGDHCCEYMTGGRTVVLGKTGRNFAAGMSGGIAYVLDIDGDFDFYCNKGLVELSPLENTDDIKEVQKMVNSHLQHTNSSVAEKILTNWDEYAPKFVKVIPLEYKKVMEELKLKALQEKLAASADEPHVRY